MTDQVLLAADPNTDADWWRQAVVYQVYPRSFADSDADGIGDIRGVTSRIGYLAALGIDAIWLSPFYPSALADGGYDVAEIRSAVERFIRPQGWDRPATPILANAITDMAPEKPSAVRRWLHSATRAGR